MNNKTITKVKNNINIIEKKRDRKHIKKYRKNVLKKI